MGLYAGCRLHSFLNDATQMEIERICESTCSNLWQSTLFVVPVPGFVAPKS